MKPGFLTSEFWVTVLIQLAGVAALFGVFTPDQTTGLNEQLPAIGNLVDSIVTDITALGAMVIAAYRYISGRSDVKKTEAAKPQVV